MGRNEFIPEKHVKARTTFRILGPLFIIIGAICMIIAFVDFVTFQGFEPRYFWLFFVGMPFLFIGFVFSGLGYGGKVARYQSREYAPVAKDTFNYLAKETTPGVKEIAKAIKQVDQKNQNVNCQKCQHINAVDARFCNECGENLLQVCAGCQHENPKDARFCNHCGNSLSVAK